jgi:hypothetical protein
LLGAGRVLVTFPAGAKIVMRATIRYGNRSEVITADYLKELLRKAIIRARKRGLKKVKRGLSEAALAELQIE